MSTPLDPTTVLETTITVDPASTPQSYADITVVVDGLGPDNSRLVTFDERIAGIGIAGTGQCPECPECPPTGPVRPTTGILYP